MLCHAAFTKLFVYRLITNEYQSNNELFVYMLITN